MNTLQKKFERFIKKEQLFEPKDKLLVAVSGGLDSVTLTHLLHSSGYSISIAHCNFQLRGNDSTSDANSVSGLAKKLEVPFHIENFETKAFASAHHLSTQLAARELRYQWFDVLTKTHHFKYLLTAHHANDQIETIFYNLAKGTGIAGLRGIPLVNDNIRRPLLFASREEIEAYASEHKLEWREDASNQDEKYSRNRIRLKVIPELKSINPGIEQTMQNNSHRFQALEKLLLNQVDLVKSKHLKETRETFSLSMNWYQTSEGGLAILIELLKPFGFNYYQCSSIGESFQNHKSVSSGKLYFSAEYNLVIDRGALEIVRKESDTPVDQWIEASCEYTSTLWADFTFESVENDGNWTKDNNKAYLDASLLEFPLKIRNWKQGDAFCPLGMRGKKKLSDFMIDEKIPVNLKSRVVLFESGSNIIWVAGHRIDDRYKITPKTKRVLIIKKTDHV